MAIAAALAIATVGSALAGGIMQAQAGTQERARAHRESLLAEEQARYTLLAGKVQQRQIRDMGYRVMGEQRAAAGKSGVAVSGSILTRQADTQTQMDQDLLTTEFNANLQARMLRARAASTREYGMQAEQAGRIGGALSALGGITRAGSYYFANQPSGGSSVSQQQLPMAESLNQWAQGMRIR